MAGFITYPLGRCAIASIAYWEKPVTKTTLIAGQATFSTFASSSPVMPGISMSRKATSGKKSFSRISRTASVVREKLCSSAEGTASLMARSSIVSDGISLSTASIFIFFPFSVCE